MVEQQADNALEPIAIVAMACRYPGADTPEVFWRNLRDGVESIRCFSDEELLAAGAAAEELADPRYVKAKGAIRGIELFDAQLFGYTPREAELMDPQQRLLLECAWEALERASLDPQRFHGRVAAYAGVGMNIYLLRNLLGRFAQGDTDDSYQMLIGSDKDFAATRLSYKLNLTGPSVAVNSACSTSLVAVHQACQSLWNYQCDAALAGGCSLLVPQEAGYRYQQGGIPSPDGHCRPFDALAQGTVPASGAGLVLLKRLEDAQRDGDTVYALIRATAVNNDGAAKVGFTAPSVEGQAAVIAEALALAEVAADSVGYVEAHGTATPLGDPIEVAALNLAFGAAHAGQRRTALGSVKSNLGHMDTAAGVAGLMKAALSLYHGQIPPSLHYRQPNPSIDFAAGPFYVAERLLPWPDQGLPRRAGVSSFGIGGTNAHVVLEQAPAVAASTPTPRGAQIMPLSAKNEAALRALAGRLAEHLDSEPDIDLADMAYSLAVGRKALECRCAVAASSREALAQALRGVAQGEQAVSRSAEAKPRLVFLFSGQGSQHAGMGEALYRGEALFRQVVDDCCSRLQASLGFDLRQALYPGLFPGGERSLDGTDIAQPALFVVEYALASQLAAWGLKPDAFIGHSLGEYVAACLAGVMSLDDALALVAERGRLMQAMAEGAMLAVLRGAADCAPYLGDGVALAASNGPDSCVLAGDVEAVRRLEQRLDQQGVPHQRLNVSRAFHSPLMEPMLEPFRQRLAKIPFNAPHTPWLSNLTGDWIDPEQATDPDYWLNHVRQPVRFHEALSRLLAEPGHILLLEVGPGRTLTGLVRRQPLEPARHALFASLPDQGESAGHGLAAALGGLWQRGCAVDWQAYYGAEQRRRLVLPTYPFQRSRCWVEPSGALSAKSQTATRRPLEQWFHIPSWRRAAAALAETAGPGKTLRVLVCGDGGAPDWLEQALDGVQVRLVLRRDGGFAGLGDGRYAVGVQSAQDFDKLLQVLGLAAYASVEWLWWAAPQAGEELFDRDYHALVLLAQRYSRLDGAPPCRVSVLTRQLFEVTGQEAALEPLQALALGPVKVIPREYPAISCRLIDLPEEEAPALLRAELAASFAAPVVALRGAYRWQAELDPAPLPPATAERLPLKQGGAYLITGGLGGVGLLLAEHLARRYRARLLLTGRSPFPARQEWPALLAAQPCRCDGAFAALADELARREQELEDAYAIRRLDDYAGLREALNGLCARYVGEYLRGIGVDAAAGSRISLEDIRGRAGLLPKFDKFLDLLLDILARDGLANLQGNDIEFLAASDWCDAAGTERLAQSFRRDYPGFAPLLDMVRHCARHYADALSGRMEAIGVLYPDGDRNLIAETGSNTVEHSNHRIYYRLLKSLVDRLADARTGQAEPLRILEIGGGSGVLTGLIAPDLAGKNVEYHFTDIGKSFVLKVQAMAAERGYDFMRFGVLDISADPEAQGYPLHSFDLIMGLDVVHATPRLSATLAQLQRLLKPDGLLCLAETAPIPRWYEMVWGLAEGWWYYEDAEDRQSGTPLLTPDQWEGVLRRQGMDELAIFPRDAAARASTDCCLIVARAPSATGENSRRPVDLLRRFQAWERAGAQVMVASADVADAEAMAAAVALARAEFGGIDGVFHAAASERRGSIAVQDPARGWEELNPKVRGAQVLDGLFRDGPLDFIALFSSLNAITGGEGNVAYCAANNYLDAFAAYARRARGYPVLAIDWDRWQGIGQALAFEQRYAARNRQGLSGGIGAAEGMEALERALASGYAQLAVSPAMGLPEPVLTPPQPESQSSALETDRPSLATAYQAPESPTQRDIAAVWQEVLGVARIGIHDNFAALGGDSLIAIRVVSRLSERFGIKLEVRAVFESGDIDKLAAQVDALRWAGQAGPRVDEEDDAYEGGVI